MTTNNNALRPTRIHSPSGSSPRLPSARHRPQTRGPLFDDLAGLRHQEMPYFHFQQQCRWHCVLEILGVDTPFRHPNDIKNHRTTHWTRQGVAIGACYFLSGECCRSLCGLEIDQDKRRPYETTQSLDILFRLIHQPQCTLRG